MAEVNNSKTVINSIHNINNTGKAKCLSTYDFSTLYTNILHDKFMTTLDRAVDKAFAGDYKVYIKLYQKRGNWSIKENQYSCSFKKNNLKESIQFLLNKSFFIFGNKILQLTVGIPMGSDLAPFFANLFLHMYESNWVQSKCRNELTTARGVETSLDSLVIHEQLMIDCICSDS